MFAFRVRSRSGWAASIALLLSGCSGGASVTAHSPAPSPEVASGDLCPTDVGPAPCAALSEALLQSIGYASDPAGAAADHGRACEDGDMEACLIRGNLEMAGASGRRDLEAASGWFQRGCEGGLAEACTNAGAVFTEGWGERGADLEKGFELAARGCAGGDAKGCFNAGLHYRNGDGVAYDPRRAASMFSRACDDGAAKGCAALAEQLVYGIGVERDLDRARGLFGQACLAGLAPACAAHEVVRDAPADQPVEREAWI